MGLRQSFADSRIMSWVAESAIVSLFMIPAVYLSQSLGIDKHLWATPVLLLSTAIVVVGSIEALKRRQFVGRIIYGWKMAQLTGVSRAYMVKPYPDSGGTEFDANQRKMAEVALREVARTSNALQLLLVSGWHYIGCMK